jgi:hypothetical protein
MRGNYKAIAEANQRIKCKKGHRMIASKCNDIIIYCSLMQQKLAVLTVPLVADLETDSLSEGT